MVEELARRIKGMCQTCQACEAPHCQKQGPVHMTPNPARVMASVCLEIFSLPSVSFEGQDFDSLVVCVDRLSGWILARPTLGKGLTARKTALLLLSG